MKTKFMKVLSVLLAMALLATTGIGALAAYQVAVPGDLVEMADITAVDAGKPVSVSIVAKKDLILNAFEGSWKSEELSFTGMASTVMALPETAGALDGNYWTAEGKLSWVDTAFPETVTAKGTTVLTAKFDTTGLAAGDYQVTFVLEVLGNDEALFDGEFTMTKTVHVHNDSATDKDHICDAEGCDKVMNDHTFGDADCENPKTCTICGATEGDALGHKWGEPAYTVNGDGTHTAKWTCGNNPLHTKSETDEHDFTLGQCVCGAENPLTVVYKGAALANAFTVKGNVVTVTFSVACRLGYWDATAGKYVAISATKIADNTYSFTVPAGVTEVLLVVKGDTTGDGKLLAGDASRIKAFVLSKTSLTAEAQFAADVTGDGKLLAGDASRLTAAILGKTTIAW